MYFTYICDVVDVLGEVLREQYICLAMQDQRDYPPECP